MRCDQSCTSTFLQKNNQKNNLDQAKLYSESDRQPLGCSVVFQEHLSVLTTYMDGKAIKKTLISSGGLNHLVKGNIHCKTSTKTF